MGFLSALHSKFILTRDVVHAAFDIFKERLYTILSFTIKFCTDALYCVVEVDLQAAVV
jgi:hypothetical protein